MIFVSKQSIVTKMELESSVSICNFFPLDKVILLLMETYFNMNI